MIVGGVNEDWPVPAEQEPLSEEELQMQMQETGQQPPES